MGDTIARNVQEQNAVRQEQKAVIEETEREIERVEEERRRQAEAEAARKAEEERRHAAAEAVRASSIISFSDQDYEVLKRIVEAEAGGCDMQGRILVANVILNRVRDSEFPSTITDVVYQRSQFSPVSDGRLNSCSSIGEDCGGSEPGTFRGRLFPGRAVLHEPYPVAVQQRQLVRRTSDLSVST